MFLHFFRLLPPAHRSRAHRVARLRLGRIRRVLRRIGRRLTLFGGWTWVAAASFIGFESFEVLLGMSALAPELLPLAIIALALAWHFRERLRTLRRRLRIRWRAARARR
ncbi:MAG: hypothetical protein ABWX66_02305 [Lacisediminihabitans sp.]